MYLPSGFAHRSLHSPGLLLVSSLFLTFSFCTSTGSLQPDSGVSERSSAETNDRQSASDCENRCLSGDCLNGAGTFEFRDCSVYEGEFQRGLRNGKGTYRFPSGAILSGNFQDGRPSGTFEYRFPGGGVFKGELQQSDVVASNGGFHIEGATGTLIEDGSSRQCVVQDLKLLCETTQADETTARKPSRPRPDAPDISPEQIRFLILYAPESAVLQRDGRSFSVSSGYPLVPGDSISTGEHSADIQGEGGFAIRLRPYSELYVPPEAQKERVLILRKGSVMVDYDGEGPLPFRIRSGGMNVDVKGTTFIVEASGEENRITVRVIEGEVQLSADQASLEKIRGEDLEKYPNLKAAVERLQTPVSVTAGEEAKSPDLEDVQISEASSPEELEKVLVGPEVKKADPEQIVKDATESALMPVLPDKKFEEVRSSSLSKDPAEREKVSLDAEEDYRGRVEERGDDLERTLQTNSTIKTAEDFQKTYDILEVVNLQNGKRRAGSIIAQAGGLLFLFAPDGLYRVPIPDVSHIDYYNREEMDLKILRDQAKERQENEGKDASDATSTSEEGDAGKKEP